MFFDLDRIDSFSHTDELVHLATNPESFTVPNALDAIMGFIGGFTVTTVQTGGTGETRVNERLQKIRQRARKLR
jgi:hypothetical protein